MYNAIATNRCCGHEACLARKQIPERTVPKEVPQNGLRHIFTFAILGTEIDFRMKEKEGQQRLRWTVMRCAALSRSSINLLTEAIIS